MCCGFRYQQEHRGLLTGIMVELTVSNFVTVLRASGNAIVGVSVEISSLRR